MTEGQRIEFDEWIERLMPKSFVTKLRSERLNAEIDFKKPLEERRRILAGRYMPLVDEFLAKELYASKETILEIIDDQEYFDSHFSYFLIEKSSQQQLDMLFDNLVQITIERKINVKRGFYSNLFYYAREREVYEKSIERILDAGLQEQYVALLVLSEKEDLNVLRRLREEQSSRKITVDFIPIYLIRVGLFSDQMFINVLAAFKPDYTSKANIMMDFLQTHRFGLVKEHAEAIMPYAKELILLYDIESASQNDVFDYSRFVAEIVQHVKDKDFIVDLNKKLIGVYQLYHLHLKLRDTYSVLLLNHTNEVWEDFVRAFVDAENPSFYLQVEHELGSGSGFGAGPLFQIDEMRVKQMCLDYPDEAPHRIAKMIPVFHYNEDKKVDRFSDWFLWLIDNFAERKYVLSGLYGNLNTFSWSGSTIPYYDRNLYCFKQLLNHHNPKVVEWANQNIEYCMRERKQEIDREEYIRLHYS